ncbi:unnamed protein product [Cylindrotheca closterium]|uniref:Uncharacterized protein n=1 Tax=Cylindrotheca closterium TaxID=2856 RepID=A0AAD2FG76_9STRA|nr:unnamed protein product [Cylindrotheca closterium]
MDTNADTCCLGKNFVIMSYTPRLANVYAYDPALPPTNVPIVSGATAYDCPQSGNTFILIFNKALYYGNRLDHSLINPNQVRKFGIPLWDNPFDEVRNIGIKTKPIFVALKANYLIQGPQLIKNLQIAPTLI